MHQESFQRCLRGFINFLWVIAISLLCLLPARPGAALSARLTHDGGNGNASKPSASDSLELEDHNDTVGYSVFARRDALPQDRILSNAWAIASAGAHFADHRLSLGLGTHFRQQKLNAGSAEPADFLPVAAFTWQHPAFRGEVAGGQKMTHAAISFLFQAIIPFEINSDFEYLYSQPYRWSANIFAFVSRYGGLILGYEPVSLSARTGLWLKPLDNLQLRSLARIAQRGETFFEISLSYSFDTLPATAAAPIEIKAKPVKKSKPLKNVPAFSTLVKWGLTPVEALRLAREKNICTLSAAGRSALKRHNWECHDEK